MADPESEVMWVNIRSPVTVPAGTPRISEVPEVEPVLTALKAGGVAASAGVASPTSMNASCEMISAYPSQPGTRLPLTFPRPKRSLFGQWSRIIVLGHKRRFFLPCLYLSRPEHVGRLGRLGLRHVRPRDRQCERKSRPAVSAVVRDASAHIGHEDLHAGETKTDRANDAWVGPSVDEPAAVGLVP